MNDNNINGAKNILLYISSGSDMEVTMEEIDEITNHILRETGEGVDVIWGAGIDDALEKSIAVTLIATGFNEQQIFHTMESKKHSLDELPKTKKTISISDKAPSNEGLENIMTKAEKERLDNEAVKKAEDEILALETAKLQAEEMRLKAEVEVCEKVEAIEFEVNDETSVQKEDYLDLRIVNSESLTIQAPQKVETKTNVFSNILEDWTNDFKSVQNKLTEEERMQKEWEEAEKSNAPLEDEENWSDSDLYKMMDDLEIIEKETITNVERSSIISMTSANRVVDQNMHIGTKSMGDFAMESEIAIDLDLLDTQASVSPQTNAKPDVHISFAGESSSNREFQASSIAPTIRHRAERLRELSDMIKTQKGLEEIENVPAYLRRNVKLETTIPSSESEAPKHVLSMDGTISSNSFFDTVD
ncbi:MAG: hypothetical protein RR190_01450 [Bacteroidales bacterium]